MSVFVYIFKLIVIAFHLVPERRQHVVVRFGSLVGVHGESLGIIDPLFFCGRVQIRAALNCTDGLLGVVGNIFAGRCAVRFFIFDFFGCGQNLVGRLRLNIFYRFLRSDRLDRNVFRFFFFAYTVNAEFGLRFFCCGLNSVFGRCGVKGLLPSDCRLTAFTFGTLRFRFVYRGCNEFFDRLVRQRNKIDAVVVRQRNKRFAVVSFLFGLFAVNGCVFTDCFDGAFFDRQNVIFVLNVFILGKCLKRFDAWLVIRLLFRLIFACFHFLVRHSVFVTVDYFGVHIYLAERYALAAPVKHGNVESLHDVGISHFVVYNLGRHKHIVICKVL